MIWHNIVKKKKRIFSIQCEREQNTVYTFEMRVDEYAHTRTTHTKTFAPITFFFLRSLYIFAFRSHLSLSLACFFLRSISFVRSFIHSIRRYHSEFNFSSYTRFSFWHSPWCIVIHNVSFSMYAAGIILN